MSTGPVSGASGRRQSGWFLTLFAVDMWERFSFFGMLAILSLYLAADPADGGLGMTDGDTAAVLGLYMALVFVSALPGGWLSDRVFGPRRATLYGGVLITAGHLLLTLPGAGWLYTGLGFVVAGSGLVKPAMAAMIGQMYAGRPQQREAAFSVFYMSIQVSALLAPLVTAYLGERVGWHWGFGAAAAGMAVGLVWYVAGWRRSAAAGAFGARTDRPARPLGPGEARRTTRRVLLYGVAPAVAVVCGAVAGVLPPQRVLMLVGLVVLAAPVLSYRSLLRDPAVGRPDRLRLRALGRLLAASSVFWLLFAQGPALLSLFAQDSVDRTIGSFTVPAGWFQSVQPLFLLVLSPLAAVLWLRLGRRTGAPVKFAGGLFAGGGAFLVMAAAASAAGIGPVTPLWLVVVYLLLVVGELAIAPIGLSLAAEVAPAGFTGRLLGLFWLFAAVGAAAGGQLAQLTAVLPEPLYYLLLALLGVVTGALLTGARGTLQQALGTPRENTAAAPAVSRPAP